MIHTSPFHLAEMSLAWKSDCQKVPGLEDNKNHLNDKLSVLLEVEVYYNWALWEHQNDLINYTPQTKIVC